MLSIIKKHGLYLTGVYEEDSIENMLQEKLRIDTKNLYIDIHNQIRSLYRSELPDSLQVLAEVEETFGSHPFHHVIIGRQKGIVKIVSERGLPIPEEFQKYCDAEIPPWQNPHINYRTLDDIPQDRAECIPPEYRK